MSLSQLMQLQSEVNALRLLVKRLVTDAVLKCDDPAKAIRCLREVVEEIGSDYDDRRQRALMKSSQRPLTTAQSLRTLVTEIAADMREEMEDQRPAA